MIARLKKQWFLIGLIVSFLLPLLDRSLFVAQGGQWLKQHHGTNFTIMLIFFISGALLQWSEVRAGLRDFTGTSAALFLIFIVAPLWAFLFSFFPLETGLLIGLFLVACMPTTISSGIVMTGVAGGNMAHALMITVIANALSVFTIPITLSILLERVFSPATTIEIDKMAIFVKLGTAVLLPLIVGSLAKRLQPEFFFHFAKKLSACNQVLILIVVWMAASSSREAMIVGQKALLPVVVTVFSYHFVLLLVAFMVTWGLGIRRGRRESVIFMGGQKTLALSVILQVSLFPQYGVALLVCLLHHLVHLAMDTVLAGYLKAKTKARRR